MRRKLFARLHLELGDVTLVALIVLSLVLAEASGFASPRFTQLAGLGLLLLLGIEFYRSVLARIAQLEQTLRSEVCHSAAETQAYVSLTKALDIEFPLPEMGAWAIEPRLACSLAEAIERTNALSVVECGAGSSTLIIAYALRRRGRGRVLSLEHQEHLAVALTAQLRIHGLEQWATVRYAPLQPVTLSGREWLWYDLAALAECKDVDLLFVDGPPGSTMPLARYPALPLLGGRLREKSEVILDDAGRPDERSIIAKWLEENPSFTAAPLPTSRPAVVLRRKNSG
ncbi:MAG: class I SAM-dependent methyltransferase [Terriglobales bacterium]